MFATQTEGQGPRKSPRRVGMRFARRYFRIPIDSTTPDRRDAKLAPCKSVLSRTRNKNLLSVEGKKEI